MEQISEEIPMQLVKQALLRALLALSLFAVTTAWCQSYPARPVRMVVPFAPGGSTDIVARVLSEKLKDEWGQTVIVDNRGGAGGVVGAEIAARASPDGYTLLLASGSILTAHKYMYALPFDPDKAFQPITNVVRAPQAVFVPSSSAIKTVKDLIEVAKSKPNTLKYGSAGVGSQIHLGAEMLLYAASITGIHIPFKGGGPALPALASGEIDFVVLNLPSGMTLIKSGRGRALAVTSAKRNEQLPDVPTVAETLPGFEAEGWFGLVSPRGTPAGVVSTVHLAAVKILRDPKNKPRLEALGMSPLGNSPTEFSKEIKTEAIIWERVIRERGLAVR